MQCHDLQKKAFERQPRQRRRNRLSLTVTCIRHSLNCSKIQKAVASVLWFTGCDMPTRVNSFRLVLGLVWHRRFFGAASVLVRPWPWDRTLEQCNSPQVWNDEGRGRRRMIGAIRSGCRSVGRTVSFRQAATLVSTGPGCWSSTKPNRVCCRRRSCRSLPMDGSARALSSSGRRRRCWIARVWQACGRPSRRKSTWRSRRSPGSSARSDRWSSSSASYRNVPTRCQLTTTLNFAASTTRRRYATATTTTRKTAKIAGHRSAASAAAAAAADDWKQPISMMRYWTSMALHVTTSASETAPRLFVSSAADREMRWNTTASRSWAAWEDCDCRLKLLQYRCIQVAVGGKIVTYRAYGCEGRPLISAAIAAQGNTRMNETLKKLRVPSESAAYVEHPGICLCYIQSRLCVWSFLHGSLSITVHSIIFPHPVHSIIFPHL